MTEQGDSVAGKPDDIPQDIWDATEALWNALAPMLSGNVRDAETVLISRAILAERERCATIAKQANEHFAKCQDEAKAARDRFKARDFESMRIASAGIAGAIRKFTLPITPGGTAVEHGGQI